MADRRLWLAALLALGCHPALAEGGRTVSGRCLAVVDGTTEARGPCAIDLAAGGGFSFQGVAGSQLVRLALVPDAGTRMGAASATDPDGDGGKGVTTALGTLKQDGACWTGPRAKLCAWDGEAEMTRNRAAPFTAFHTLLNKDVRARCQMGECEWLRYDRATIVLHDDHEVVLKIDGRSWTTDHVEDRYDRPGKVANRTKDTLYFRCSHSRPAHLAKGRGKTWTVSPYRPDSEDGFSGATQYTYTAYAAACEGLDHAIGTDEGRLLGYDTGVGRASGAPLAGGSTDASR